MSADEAIHLVFYGKAEPSGSKKSNVVYRKVDGVRQPVMRGGRVLTIVRDDNEKAKPYKDRLAWEAAQQYGGPVLTGPLVVEIVFFEVRPKKHYGTGRNERVLKDSAPAKPTVKPDALKLARGVEDALTGVVWADDCLTCDLIARKRYVGRDEQARVEVWVQADPLATVGDMVAHGVEVPARPRTLTDDQLELVV